MKKRTRKLIFGVFIVALVAWNIQLSYQVNQLSSRIKSSTHTVETIERIKTDVQTQLTDVVKKNQNKIVTVSNYRRNKLSGSGSGVVYAVDKREITLVTNHHVIDEATTIKVKFINGNEYDAILIGSDEYSDLAVLKTTIDFDIDPIALGDSTLLDVGEQVLAIGSPLGEAYQGSVSYGIISGKDRSVSIDLDGNGTSDWDMNVLQTDAAINPGNSGGALINLAGELVGIPSSKIISSNGESVEGIGFAIPVNEVIPIVTQITENQKVTRPIVGISAVAIDDMNPYQKQYYKIKSEQKGLYVTEVTNRGAADKAGIKAGDIIVLFNQSTIRTFKEFRQLLYAQTPKDKVLLTISRNGVQLELEVILD